MRKNKICFVSIDVEHDIGSDGDKKFIGVDNMDVLLDLFRKFSVPATLFVTGDVFTRYPEEVRRWSKDYEIASHSYSHRFFNKLTKWEKSEDIERGIEVYNGVLGKRPRGFRAPSHIIDNETMMILAGKGFIYDSSVVPRYPPFKNYDGYRGEAPCMPYRPSEMNYRKVGDMRIIEIPVSGQLFGVPVAGTWANRLPAGIYKFLFFVHNPDFVMLSLHSWDSFSSKKFHNKVEEIISVIKKFGYEFKTGEQIADEFCKN